jgi:hypothetical protein
MKAVIYFSILIVLNSSNCSTQQNFKEIKFGEGGGFTGIVTEYQIKANGDIFIIKSLEKENKKIKTINKSQLKNIENKISKISKESLSFNHPGNLYYFIETDQTKIVWGDPTFPEPIDIKELYNYLKQILVIK